VRIPPGSFAFTLMLGLLATLPTFGIDMLLPAMSATGAALGVPPARVGLAMSVYLLGLGGALLFYGPVSDRYGRKPVAIFGCAITMIASIGCASAPSLSALLAWRVVQGAGTAAPGMMAVAIVRDLFDEKAARAKISFIVGAINVVPMIAPTCGAVILTLAGWRLIYLPAFGAALLLLLVMSRGFTESASIDTTSSLTPGTVVNNYLSVLRNPACIGYILVNAAAAGAVFAYITGSSLFFINVLGLGPEQYGLIFGASSISVMGGAFLNGRLGLLGIAPGQLLTLGLVLSTVFSSLLLVATLGGWTSESLVVSVMVGVALSFGFISPNATSGAMQPLPRIAGSVSAVVGLLQTTASAGSSAVVAIFFDGHSALSMAGAMLFFSLLAAGFYLRVVYPARKILA
jgi:DHA1 family bicyclomycin/chloramphenicol resistance-like MFS transporter